MFRVWGVYEFWGLLPESCDLTLIEFAQKRVGLGEAS